MIYLCQLITDCDKWVLLYERVSQHWTLDDFWTAFMQQVSKHGDLTSMFMDPRKLLNHCRQCYINICNLRKFKPQQEGNSMQIWKGTTYYNLRDKSIISFCRSSLPTSCWKTFWIIVPDTTAEALALCNTRQTSSPCFFPRGTPLLPNSAESEDSHFHPWIFIFPLAFC